MMLLKALLVRSQKKAKLPNAYAPIAPIKAIATPLLFLALLTPWSSQLDVWISHCFYRNSHFIAHPLLEWIFHYGLIPAWIAVGLAVVGWIVSYLCPPYRKWRACCTFLVLVLAIGSGLITHALLKDHWGRPRPKQVLEFGGQQPFRAYYQPNFFHQPEPSKSFPCGHCSMGFYFFAWILLGRHYQHRGLYQIGMLLSWGLGGTLSFTRIAQGGHFFSDVVVSAIVMWVTAFALYHILLGGKKVSP